MLLCKIHVFHLLVPWELQEFPSFIAHPDATKYFLHFHLYTPSIRDAPIGGLRSQIYGRSHQFPLALFLFVMNTHFDGFRCLAYLKWKELIFPGIMNWIFHELSTPSKIERNLKVNLRDVIQPEQTLIDRCQIIFMRRLRWQCWKIWEVPLRHITCF